MDFSMIFDIFEILIKEKSKFYKEVGKFDLYNNFNNYEEVV